MQRFISIYSCLFLILLGPLNLNAQTQVSDEILNSLDDDLNVGGDIFSNFSEDVEDSKVLEDERFYRYGRFFSVNLATGYTSYSGNRGNAYQESTPSFGLAVNYFLNFRSSISLGVQYSSHEMEVNSNTRKYTGTGTLLGPGSINVTMLRPYLAYRYYIDTDDLSTPFTYSNPYLNLRLEYWYQTNRFADDLSNAERKQSGGGIGVGAGFGFEFPIKIKELYIGTEIMAHFVNFFDKDTRDFEQLENDVNSPYGYDNLSGIAYSVFISVNQTW